VTDSDVVPEQVKDWLTPKLTLTLTPTLNSIQGQRLAHAHHVRTSLLTHPPSVSLSSGLGSWSFPQLFVSKSADLVLALFTLPSILALTTTLTSAMTLT